ncbi:hypothetical protein O181_104202 [Austropuccinia psidii MF-1]|uniref:Uncharacterized protein n=1 Tax=Austropuccinia psidii MF-1 TaxID=1389203 RepID=A0A9Q3PL73_9BASI|nr:hypothetical protein [Austropuccinia psidii MF-1]
MSHTLTYHSIQNFQLCHHHVGKGIGPYAPAPAWAHIHAYAHTPTLADTHTKANATAPADAHAHANATAPADAHANAPPYANANATTLHLWYCAAGSTSVIRKTTILRRGSPFMDDLVSFEWDCFIIDSPKGGDLITGYDFLYHFNPIIYWKNGLITYDSSNKDSSGILYSASNDFATAVNSVSLVGGLEKPSLPSSVHIPPIIPSQSLLPLRDEVFKEIKDVRKDVAISSLHLFQGDMNRPPFSFHASLEDQWDEEEEPEDIKTVLKVVPPSYHQYLHVFSKVKA